MSESDFKKQREKWGRWLEERRAAGTAHEPLLVFVDDEEYQRNMRYYEMRLQKHPGRNILLFKSTDEAIEFIQFATEKQLYLGAVVSDFDNGKDKNGVQIETYGSKVLMAAAEYGKTLSHPVIKLEISSTHRPISLSHEHNKPLAEFNTTDEAKRQGKIFSFQKNEFEIEKMLAYAPKPEKSQSENPKLIPELIFTMNIMDKMLEKFKEEFKPYRKKIPPGQVGEAKTIAEIYAPALKMVKNAERRIKNMLKIWALVKDYEFTQEKESNWQIYSNNREAEEPEDPINVRVLGQFFLKEFKQIKSDFSLYQKEFLTFSSVVDVIRAKNSSLEENEVDIMVSKVTHNLKGPMLAMGKQVEAMITHIDEYLKNPPAPPMQQDETNAFRFTYDHLRKMILEYLTGISKPKFFYMGSKTSTDGQATKDRTENTPGEVAPSRQTIGIPKSIAEAEIKQQSGKLVKVKKMKKEYLEQFVLTINEEEKGMPKKQKIATSSAVADGLLHLFQSRLKSNSPSIP